MSTQIATRNPVRSDVRTPGASPTTAAAPRAWALAGIGAGLAGLGTIVTSSMAGYIYEDRFRHSVAGATDALGEKGGVITAMHVFTMLSAVLVLVFGAGLYRRLRAIAPDSAAPVVALVALAGQAAVSVMGAGLDTEFLNAPGQDGPSADDASAAFFGHWLGTIPWLWVLAGVAGVAIWSAARQANEAGTIGLPRWIARVGLVLGGLTMVLGISPLEYMSGMTGPLWLLATAIGFVVGDRAFRARAGA